MRKDTIFSLFGPIEYKSGNSTQLHIAKHKEKNKMNESVRLKTVKNGRFLSYV